MKLGYLNINSQPNKFDQRRVVISDYIDILFIVETRLDEAFPTRQFLAVFL